MSLLRTTTTKRTRRRRRKQIEEQLNVNLNRILTTRNK